MSQVLITYTARGKDKILSDGGSAAWTVNANNASKAKYVVCVQNLRAKRSGDDWGKASHQHGEAFIVGKVSDVVSVPVKKGPPRWLIEFSEYAEINIPNMWNGQRFPVRYETDDNIDIDFNALSFKPMPGKGAEVELKPEDNIKSEHHFSLEEAKDALSKVSGFDVSTIKILMPH